MISKQDMATIMEHVFSELRTLRAAGQAEYALEDANAFSNFERTGAELGLSRETVLLVFLNKHLDGIRSWVRGHKSQREGVEGRINDAIVYLILLRGMVADARNTERKEEAAS